MRRLTSALSQFPIGVCTSSTFKRPYRVSVHLPEPGGLELGTVKSPTLSTGRSLADPTSRSCQMPLSGGEWGNNRFATTAITMAALHGKERVRERAADTIGTCVTYEVVSHVPTFFITTAAICQGPLFVVGFFVIIIAIPLVVASLSTS